MNRLLLSLVTLFACGLIAAGCGDDDDDGGSSDAPETTESTPAAAPESEGDSPSERDGGGDAAPGLSDEQIEEAVESCRQNVQTAGGQLSEDLKSDLEQLCEDAAEGDEEEVREASVEICERVVDETVPAGPGREQALAACEQAGQTP